jgi:hypothetical protein
MAFPDATNVIIGSLSWLLRNDQSVRPGHARVSQTGVLVI